MRKSKIAVALGVLGATSLLAILANGVFGRIFCVARPWLLGNSVSWYVGCAGWTTVIFALGNCVVALLLSGYLWSLGEKYQAKKIFYVMAGVLVGALLMLSVCPVTMLPDGSKAPITYFHEVSSRTMFAMMLLISLYLGLNKRVNPGARVAGWMFVVLALVSATGYFINAPWFMPEILIWELAYLAGFMTVLLLVKNPKD